MGAIWQDVKHAGRRLAASPGFTAVAVASLALGIGANTALFSLVNALVLRELPVWQPDRLGEVRELEARSGQAEPLSMAMFLGLARDQRVFSAFSGELNNGAFNVKANGWLGLANVSLVTGEFFTVLGTRPTAGRLLQPSDVNLPRGPAEHVAVLGYGFWQRRYGGDPSAIGRIVEVEGASFTIVGVTPKGFTGTRIDETPDLMLPLTAAPLVISEAFASDLDSRHLLWITGVGRLNAGVTLARAQADLDTVWPAIRSAALPPDENEDGRNNFLARRVVVRSDARGDEDELRAKFTRPLEILLGISGLILLVACANLAGLMLARAAGRDQEMSIRIALGAGRSRLARELMVEGLLPAVGGACAGVGLAWAGSRALVAAITAAYVVPATLDVRPDARVLLFTAALAILVGVLFSLAPAWRATRQDAIEAMRAGSRVAGNTGRLGKLVVVTQLAVALILLSCAGLLVRSFVALSSVSPGYESRGVLVARMAALPGDKAALRNDEYWGGLARSIAGLPGVVSAAMGSVPGTGPGPEYKPAVAPTDSPAGSGQLASLAYISPGYFRTLGMSVVAGRDFSWGDTADTPRAGIVSRSLAERLFPAGGAIGRLLRIGPDPRLQRVEIVGVATDARLFNSRDPSLLTIYVSLTQDKEFDQSTAIEVRTAGSPDAVAGALRQAIEAAGHENPVSFQTLDRVRALADIDGRVTALLSSFFGGLGLLLAAIGLFGLVSYSVTLRTREIGLRLALGAEAASIRGMVLREIAALAGAGAAIGLACAVAARRLLAGMLFQAGAHDASALGVVVVIFFIVALLAGYLPARRAMRVDPNLALRHE